MIIYHPNGEIMATGSKIDIVDAQGETNLIRVYPDEGDGFYFIGTNDRHEYVIADVALLQIMPQESIPLMVRHLLQKRDNLKVRKKNGN
jgi:hypothetical protein